MFPFGLDVFFAFPGYFLSFFLAGTFLVSFFGFLLYFFDDCLDLDLLFLPSSEKSLSDSASVKSL